MAFALGMVLISPIISFLGMLGGFIIGALNALIIGATLYLTEQAVLGARRLQWKDVPQSMGQYFWDVISVGFMVWFPLLFLEMGLQTNPYQPLIATAIFFLIFVLLNPVPEVIYQGRHGSALEVIQKSYAFILENWIEWFLPLAIALAPLGLSFFFQISSQAGRRGGLDFLVSSHLTLYHLIPMALFSRYFTQHEFYCCPGVNSYSHSLHITFSGPSLCSSSSFLPPPTYVSITSILRQVRSEKGEVRGQK